MANDVIKTTILDEQKRLKLYDILHNIVDNVYFQSPENVKLKYPCIICKREDDYTFNADNLVYSNFLRYSLTYIDKNPISEIPAKLRELEYCKLNRVFTKDELNHWVYRIYI